MAPFQTVLSSIRDLSLFRRRDRYPRGPNIPRRRFSLSLRGQNQAPSNVANPAQAANNMTSQSVLHPDSQEDQGKWYTVSRGEDLRAKPLKSSAKKIEFEIVSLSVGAAPYDRVFYVHKALLCRKVEYFRRMFTDPFEEAQSGTATFPEDDPDTFDILMEWVYRGRLPRPYFLGTQVKEFNWDPLRLYALADKLDLHDLMHQSLDVYATSLSDLEKLPDPLEFEKVYLWTSEGSTARTLFGEVYLFILFNKNRLKGQEEHNWGEVLSLHRDLVIDMHQGISKVRAHPLRNPLHYVHKCRYHLQDSARPCPWAWMDD